MVKTVVNTLPPIPPPRTVFLLSTSSTSDR